MAKSVNDSSKTYNKLRLIIAYRSFTSESTENTQFLSNACVCFGNHIAVYFSRIHLAKLESKMGLTITNWQVCKFYYTHKKNRTLLLRRKVPGSKQLLSKLQEAN